MKKDPSGFHFCLRKIRIKRKTVIWRVKTEFCKQTCQLHIAATKMGKVRDIPTQKFAGKHWLFVAVLEDG